MFPEKIAEYYIAKLKHRREYILPSRIAFSNDRLIGDGVKLCRSFTRLPDFAADIYGEFMAISMLRNILPNSSSSYSSLPNFIQNFLGKNDHSSLATRANERVLEISKAVKDPKFTLGTGGPNYWDMWIESAIQAGRVDGFELGHKIDNLGPKSLTDYVRERLVLLGGSLPPATLSQVDVLKDLIKGRESKGLIYKIFSFDLGNPDPISSR